MRIANWSGAVARQFVGDPAGPFPADPGSVEIAVGRSRGGAHVPAIRCVQFARGLQMFGHQRRVLLHRRRLTLLNRGGHAPVPLGAIGCQLRFVGHRADQRVAEGVLRRLG